ncbi:MAG: phosphodiester glycosidase family protein [Verrucomicrobiota bacterium]
MGCYPAKPESPAPERAKPVVASPAPPAVVIPSTPAAPPRLTVKEISGITFEGVAFDSRNHRLAVVDQAGGPGSKFEDSAAAAASKNGIAAVNAGFFTPEGAPLGLVAAGGKVSGSWNTASSLGSGAWYENTSGEMTISRRDKLGRSAAANQRELIQAGPLLVENSQPVSGLEATKTSARIFILWDGGTRWWIGRTSPCTLAAVASAIGNGEPASWRVRHALNLDGGRSADLWISSQVSGGPLTRRTPWNRPVRNFLVLLPK